MQVLLPYPLSQPTSSKLGQTKYNCTSNMHLYLSWHVIFSYEEGQQKPPSIVFKPVLPPWSFTPALGSIKPAWSRQGSVWWMPAYFKEGPCVYGDWGKCTIEPSNANHMRALFSSDITEPPPHCPVAWFSRGMGLKSLGAILFHVMHNFSFLFTAAFRRCTLHLLSIFFILLVCWNSATPLCHNCLVRPSPASSAFPVLAEDFFLV